MSYTPQVNSANMIMGPGAFLISSRDVPLPSVSPLASPAATTTTFTVSPTDAAKLYKGDILNLASATPTFAPDEASTLPVVQSIKLVGGNYLVTVSPAFGSIPASGSASVVQQWDNRGGTLGGLKSMLTKTTKDLKADQSQYAIDAVDQGAQATFEAKLAEATLQNLALTAGFKDPASATRFQGRSTDKGRRDRVLIIGPAPSGLTRWLVYNKTVMNGTATDEFTLDGQRVYDLKGTAYVDSTMDPDVFDYYDVA